ncbi:MAG TPA: transposase [Thermoanaerobaculia bacterium]
MRVLIPDSRAASGLLPTERLVRYLMRAPVSQERMEVDPDLAEVRLRPKAAADDGRAEDEIERLDPDEAVARIIAQIPEPRKHLIHSYGRYANAARAKRDRDAAASPDSLAPAVPAPAASEPDSAERKAARKRWANLIRHIYEVDPLVCPRCGAIMKIIAFITEPRVVHAILDSLRGRTPSTAGSRHPPPPARPAADGVH